MYRLDKDGWHIPNLTIIEKPNHNKSLFSLIPFSVSSAQTSPATAQALLKEQPADPTAFLCRWAQATENVSSSVPYVVSLILNSHLYTLQYIKST